MLKNRIILNIYFYINNTVVIQQTATLTSYIPVKKLVWHSTVVQDDGQMIKNRKTFKRFQSCIRCPKLFKKVNSSGVYRVSRVASGIDFLSIPKHQVK